MAKAASRQAGWVGPVLLLPFSSKAPAFTHRIYNLDILAALNNGQHLLDGEQCEERNAKIGVANDASLALQEQAKKFCACLQ
eukprot:366228-Chlamydomonas_euryale.AAC.7